MRRFSFSGSDVGQSEFPGNDEARPRDAAVDAVAAMSGCGDGMRGVRREREDARRTC